MRPISIAIALSLSKLRSWHANSWGQLFYSELPERHRSGLIVAL
ncbi:hypothetical protein RISK_006362 [Rhodopirellula islandica]|uniref:Uncharacterized protein n=1 Tax=Rhodopirellula islandica TaxID=595434 RepID=A0A0J1B580_RHOIS|nr:hypothetical protein RISK_006362 [Rhodopirellula islandica]